MASTKGTKATAPILKAVINKGIRAYDLPESGHVYAKLPFKYKCTAGRIYLWCTCGWSKTQPFCDGSHNDFRWKIQLKPLRFECTETREYWFCQCKQSKSRPFCDGSHNTEKVMSAKSTIHHHLMQQQ